MHSNPHSAPCQSDVDAPFSRFNYVDPSLYQSLLEENRLSLLQERKSTSSETLDYTFLTMALEIVSGQQQSAKDETHEEIVLQERFAKETSGIYQRQSPALIYHPKQSHDNAQSSPSNRSTDSKAAEGKKIPNAFTLRHSEGTERIELARLDWAYPNLSTFCQL